MRVSSPTVDPEPAVPRTRKHASDLPRRRRLGRWFRRLALAAVAVVMLPPALTLVYLMPQVRPVSTLMMRDLVMLDPPARQWVELDAIAPALVHSIVMSEDGQFCSHHGIDWRELNAVIDSALAGQVTRGASTIPMQTVKNLFLWHGRSFVRKAVEAPLAVYMDAVMPKRRILEIYLNIVEWGAGIYGAEAAAQAHFGRSARDLNARQAALLAAALPNPTVRDPARPSRAMTRVAAVVEQRARRARDYVACLR